MHITETAKLGDIVELFRPAIAEREGTSDFQVEFEMKVRISGTSHFT